MRSVLIMMLVAGLACPALAQNATVPDTVEKIDTAAVPDQAGAPSEIPEIESSLSIGEMAFCTGIVEREPEGAAEEFSSDIGTIYFWSNILNDGDEASVSHVWYFNGQEKARVERPARYPRNRVWSSKRILPEWTGEWEVEVISDQGVTLGEETCTVK